MSRGKGAPRAERPDRPRLYPDDYREALLRLRGPYHTRRVTDKTIAQSLGISADMYYKQKRLGREAPDEYERKSFPDILAEELFSHCLDVLEIAIQGIIDLGPYLEDQELSTEQLKRFQALVDKLLAEQGEYRGDE